MAPDLVLRCIDKLSDPLSYGHVNYGFLDPLDLYFCVLKKIFDKLLVSHCESSTAGVGKLPIRPTQFSTNCCLTLDL